MNECVPNVNTTKFGNWRNSRRELRTDEPTVRSGFENQARILWMETQKTHVQTETTETTETQG